MTTSVISKEFEEYQTQIDVKFAELEKIAYQKISLLSPDELVEYKKVIADQQTFIKTKIASYNAIKTGSQIEKEFWNNSVKPYLVSFGINPVEKESIITFSNSKGEKQTKTVIKMLNNMKDNWKSGDKELAIIDILTNAQIPTLLRNSLKNNTLDENTTVKYKSYIDAAGKEATIDFKITNLTIDKHKLKLKKNLLLANYKMNCINARSNEINLVNAQKKKVESRTPLDTLCKSSLRYNESTSLLGKKYCIQ